ncbi:hypothetical protein HPB48_018845 [Haemaphysalis longicornis]|uniref:Speckle-type POZ protein n=1 Tax=Haemaphysalis longicornis TaxID=44386 RepID=A0A9J6H4X8_HAELO|nr:hypothetical protein HPB48_018845 [Haemaphysalis longicornis]
MQAEPSRNAVACTSTPERISTEVSVSCQAQLNTTKTSCTWTVRGFSKLPEVPGTSIGSSACFASPDDPVRWYLELFPRGHTEKLKEHVSLFLVLLSSDKGQKAEVDAEFTFFLLDGSGKQRVGKGPDIHKFTPEDSWGYEDFVDRKLLFDSTRELLPDDKLTVYCEVRIFQKSDAKTILSAAPRCRLQQNLHDLFENQLFSDVTLNVGGKAIKAHRNILEARSPVFAAMFEHDMREKFQSRVDITDVDYDTMLEVVRFIYTHAQYRRNG